MDAIEPMRSIEMLPPKGSTGRSGSVPLRAALTCTVYL